MLPFPLIAVKLERIHHVRSVDHGVLACEVVTYPRFGFPRDLSKRSGLCHCRLLANEAQPSNGDHSQRNFLALKLGLASYSKSEFNPWECTRREMSEILHTSFLGITSCPQSCFLMPNVSISLRLNKMFGQHLSADVTNALLVLLVINKKL